MMNRTARILAAGGLTLAIGSFDTPQIAPTAHASSGGAYYVYADVVHVEPIIRHRTIDRPREVCETIAFDRGFASRDHGPYPRRYRRHGLDGPRHEPGPVPGILGGIVGGLIGNQFGGGRGKKLLTITGALAGASIADRAARDSYRRSYDRPARAQRARQCWTVSDVETINRVDGYRVTYRYQGRQFVKEMPTHPGDQVRIRVSVAAL